MAQGTKAEKGTGKSVNIDFTDNAPLLAKIRESAQADDRAISVWLRRKLVELDKAGYLFK